MTASTFGVVQSFAWAAASPGLATRRSRRSPSRCFAASASVGAQVGRLVLQLLGVDIDVRAALRERHTRLPARRLH